jgi:hypothetical protein
VVEISFVHAKWWCEEGWIYIGIARSEMGGEHGGLLLETTGNKKGSLEVNG